MSNIEAKLVTNLLSKHFVRQQVYTFYSHQLMHFFIQLCISLLSYIKIA